jgi:NarL family two-component system sensor histidine kinase YdfH
METMNRRKWPLVLFDSQTSEFPFFVFLTLILLGMAVYSVVASPEALTPARLIPFVVLMLVHVGLYWLSADLATSSTATIIYLIIQGLLAFAINLLIGNLAMSFGLYMGLIGLTVGLLHLQRMSLAFLGYFLGLSILSYGLNAGWRDISWWALAVAPMSIFVIIYVSLYNRQVQARDRAQALLDELEQANQRLAEYANQVEELTLAGERERMARELHDTLSQGLAGLILKLEAVDVHLSNGGTERAQSIVQQAMQQARTTLGEARRAIGDLREAPNLVQQPVGLLNAEIERFSEVSGVACQANLALPARLAPGLYETLWRTLCEGLLNISRHAHASRVEVTVRSDDDWLEMEIRDDGWGFDLQTAQRTGHYGLLGLRERARMAQGSLQVESQPGQGTVLRLRLPLAGDLGGAA